MNPFEVVGVVTGLLGVWLMTRQKIWGWPVLLVSSVVFIVVFFRARLYAAMGLQFVYIGLVAYGWYAVAARRAPGTGRCACRACRAASPWRWPPPERR